MKMPRPFSRRRSVEAEPATLPAGQPAASSPLVVDDGWVGSVPIQFGDSDMLRSHLRLQRRLQARQAAGSIIAVDAAALTRVASLDAEVLATEDRIRSLSRQLHAVTGGVGAEHRRRRVASQRHRERAALASLRAEREATSERIDLDRRSARSRLVDAVAVIDHHVVAELTAILNARGSQLRLDEWLECWRGLEGGLHDSDPIEDVAFPWEADASAIDDLESMTTTDVEVLDLDGVASDASESIGTPSTDQT